MPNGTYGGVRGKETKVGQKTFVSRPTRFTALFSDPGEARTLDPLIKSQLLYQLSYGVIFALAFVSNAVQS